MTDISTDHDPLKFQSRLPIGHKVLDPTWFFDILIMTQISWTVTNFGVYLDVKTCEVFLCFVAIVRIRVYYVDFFVFRCFTSLVSVTGWAQFCSPTLYFKTTAFVFLYRMFFIQLSAIFNFGGINLRQKVEISCEWKFAVANCHSVSLCL